MPIEYISSLQNQKIKRVVLLQQKSSERRKEGLFVVEGRREILHCCEAGYELDSAFCCLSLTENGDAPEDFQSFIDSLSCPVYMVSSPVYDKIAYRGGTEGILAVVKMKTKSLEDLRLSDNPLLMVVESVEKPGNLGAILRSADASATDAVIVCDPLTDLFNPNLDPFVYWCCLQRPMCYMYFRGVYFLFEKERYPDIDSPVAGFEFLLRC